MPWLIFLSLFERPFPHGSRMALTAALLLAGGGAAPVFADVLVSNIGQTKTNSGAELDTLDLASSFTTGSSAATLPTSTNTPDTVTLNNPGSWSDDNNMFTAPAAAQDTRVLVSNYDQRITGDTTYRNDNNRYAQKFRTGDNPEGYLVTNVKIRLDTGSTGVRVSIREGGTNPGSQLYDLGTIEGRNPEITAPVGAILEPDTDYFIEFRGVASSHKARTYETTSNNAEDSSGLNDWDIADDCRHYSSGSWRGCFPSGASLSIRINGIVLQTIPAPLGAQVRGDKLVIRFSEPLAEAANLSNDAFAVTKGSSDTEVTLSSTGPVISGDMVTLTLATAAVQTDTNFKVDYAAPDSGSDNLLKDTDDNEVADFDDLAVTNLPASTAAPTASNGTVTATEDGGAYTFQAPDFNFSDTDTHDALESVLIESLPGSGKGVLKLDDALIVANNLGLRVSRAQLDAGELTYEPPADESGDNYTTFTFKVSDGASDSTSNYTMTIDVDNVPDILPLTDDDTSGVRVTSTPNSGNTYGLGEKIRVTVTFDEAVTVTGTPVFEIRLGGPNPAVTRNAVYLTGPATTALVFQYTVLANDRDDNGIWINANALKLNGGTIKDSGNNNADITHARLGTQSGHRVFAAPQNTPPTSADKTVETDEDTTYTFAATDFAFDDVDADDTALASVKIVTVETAGDLELSGTDVAANNVIMAADIGNLVFTPAADWNGSASFTFKVNDGEDDSASAYTMTINVDSVPDVTGVAVTSTPTSGTTPKKYGAGEKIRITATFDEDVTVTGDPVINVEVGSNSRPAAYVSGSTTTELMFEYTVVAADSDTDGISINANALGLNSGTIKDSDSNDADITHAALATQSDHQVDGSLTATDTTAPTVVSAVVAAAAPKELVLTFDQDLDTAHEPGTGAFAFKINGGSSLDLASVKFDSTDATKLKIGIPALTAADMNVTVAYTKPGSEDARLQNANGDEVEDFTVAVTNSTVACPSGQPSDAFWEACLTVGRSGNDFGLTDNTQGSLSPVSFMHDGTEYTIDRIFRSSSGLSLSFDKALPDVLGFWSFQIGSSGTYRLGARDSYTASTFTYVWSSPGFTWTDASVGDKVSVSLRLGNRPPTASNRTVDMDEDTTYTFSVSDFGYSDADSDPLDSVRVLNRFDDYGNLEFDGNVLPVDSINQVIPVADITAGKLKFTPAANGNGALYTGFAFTVNDGTADSTNVYSMAINVDSVPDVTQVAVTSTPTSGTTPKKYGAGEKIQITATFDEDVTVTGTPVINVEVGSNSRPAAYVSGTGTTALVFEYTVVAADSDTDGISISADALGLNSGTIKDSDSHDADITHAALATQSDHQVDGSLTPPTAPKVVSAVVAAAAPKVMVLTFDEALADDSTPAAAAFAVKVGGSAVSGLSVSSVEIDGTDATKVNLGLSVALDAGQSTVTVDYTNPGTANSPLKDAANNEVATFTGQSVTNNAPACPDTASFPADALWTACLTVGVSSSGNDFGLVGDGSGEGALSPASFTHEGTEYTIDGIVESGTTLSLSFDRALPDASNAWAFRGLLGSTLLYIRGNAGHDTTTHTYTWNTPDDIWTAANVGDKMSVGLVLDHRPFASDSTVDMDEDTPYVFQASDFPYTHTGGDFPLESVVIESLPTNGQLKLDGTVLTMSDVEFGYSVTRAQLDANQLTYEPPDDANGTGYAMFDFSVLVNGQAGFKFVGDVFGFATMTINVDSVPDVTQVAVTSEPTSGTTPKKYGAGEKIRITATFDEDVTVTGSPVINVEVGSNSRSAAYVSGTGTTALVFEYTVVAADTDSDGISINANALGLNSGTIKDSDSHDADITHAALAAQSDHQVDGSLTPDETAPTVTGAEVALDAPKSLAITFNEALDTTSVPAASAFTVKVDGTAEATPTNVSISGAVVTLTLATALDAGQTNVTVDYTNPGTSNNPLKDAADNEVATFTNQAVTNNAPACPTGQPGDAFWTACLTVGADGNWYGLSGSNGALSDTMFTRGGETSYTIDGLRARSTDNRLELSFTVDLRDTVAETWILHVGSEDFKIKDRNDFSGGQNSFLWDSTAITWAAANAGDKVSVSLTQGNRPPTASDETINMAEDGSYTFQESDFGFMDDDATDSLVSVKITGVETAGALKFSGTDVSVNDVIAVASIPNLTFEPAADGNGAPYDSFTFKVNDGEDDSVADYTMTINVDSVPDVTNVEVTSTPRAATDTYGLGEVIQVTVTFDEAVMVDTSGGTPFFRLRISDGSNINDRDAAYLSGSGTTALVFGYTVVAADDDDDGISIDMNALGLNGGTIQNDGSNAADLDHNGLGTQSSHKVDGSLDNDMAGVSVSPTSLSLAEGETTTYTVVLITEPSGTVTVTPSSNDTGAATFSPSGLTFTSSNWGTAQTVTVSGEEDDDANNETVTVSHSVSGYDSVSTADDVSVTVSDNDTAGVSISPTSLSVNEGGTTTYTVVLDTEPNSSVTVTPSSGDTDVATLSPASLTFTSSNWDTAQTITVSGEEDVNSDDETVTVSHSVSGYGAVTTADSVSVTVSDNDTPGVSVSPTSLSVDESGTTTYTVVLNTDPSGSVTVTPSSGDTDVATLNPASLTFTSSNWDTAQTVTVSGQEDDDANDETVTVSHSVSGYSGVTTVADVSVTVTDNDTAGVSVSPTSLSLAEGETTTYTVVLITEPSGTVTVTPSSNDTGAATFSPSGLTFTSSNWDTAQTVTVSGEEDDDANNQTVTVSHSVSGYDSVTTADDVSVTVSDNDTAGVSISPTSLSVNEGGTTTYTVVLDTEPNSTVTVTPSSDDTGAATLSPASLTFTSSNWSTAQTVTVSGEEDVNSDDETVTVSHSVSGYGDVTTADSVSVTVSDNDTAGVSVSPTSLSVDESGTTTYTVVLNTDPSGSVTVTPSSGDTDVATLNPASLTFTSSNWDTAQTITVSGEEDDDANDETVTVSHSVSGYSGVTTAADVSVTVTDNDTAGVSVSPTSLSVDESGTTTYTVVLDTEPSGTVTVTPSSADTGAATFSPSGLTFTSSNWNTAQTVTVSGEEDDDANNETVTVSHSVSGYSGVTTAADVSVTVTDNDTAGVSVSPTSLSVDESGTTTYTVVLDTEPSGSVTVTPSSNDTGAVTLSPASLTFTSSNWNTAQTMTVTGVEDDDANDETVTVSHSVSGYDSVTTADDVSVTVSDNDTAGVSISPTSLSVNEGGTTTYTVVLDTEPNSSVTVTPSSGDTDVATLSPASLTFTSGNWDTAQTITVSGEEDVNSDDETVTVSHSVSGYGAVTTADSVSVTVSDNDTPGVNVSPTSLSVDESGTTTYTVVLNTDPSGSVTVTPSSDDTGAATLNPASLTFTSSNWNTAQNITVSGEEDDDANDETVTVSHSVSGYSGVTTAADVSVTVTDNDTAGVSVSPTSLSVDESGTTTYTVVLDTEPSGSVTVTPSSNDTGAATFSPSGLTFTSSNWNTAQTVTVSGEEDDDANNETVTVSHSVSGYDSVTTADDVSVTVSDNDTAGVSISPTSLSVNEGGTTTYTVVLDTEPSGTVTVTPSSNDTGAATFSPSGLTFTSSNWNTAQTVTVSGEDDDDANDETVTVSHSVSGYDSVTTADDVSVTVSDNDTAGVSISPTSLSVNEGGTTTYTVVLDTEPNSSVTVTPSSGDTDVATLSPASLTFTSSNWDTAQTITISGEEDVNSDDETVTVSHSVSGYGAVTTADSVSVTVSDNDTPGVNVSPTSLSVDESGTTTYSVVLNTDPSGSVTVTPSSGDTGAATLSPSGLTFTSSNWNTAQTVTVSGEEDDDANDETVTVSHSVSGYSGVTTVADVSVTVTDNDTAGVSVSPTSLSLAEGETTTYTVVLMTEPNGSVTVTPSSDDTGAATFSPSGLTFTSSNWNTAQTVTVSGEEDDDANNETVTVSHSVSGYDSVSTADDVSVTVNDNDTAGVSVSPTSLSVDESGTTTYTVVLNTEPSGSVTVTPSSNDTGAATLSPSGLTFTSSNWNTAQTVTVSGEEDDDANNETVTVSHSVSGYDSVSTADDVSVTVTDDDTAGVSVSPTSLSVNEGGTTTYTVVLDTEPNSSVTVTPSSGDTDVATLSPASLTFTSSNWDTAQTITVSGEEDVNSDDETVTVSHSVSGYGAVTTADSVSVTVSDNDTPGVNVSPTSLSVDEGGTTTYTVVLDTEPNSSVTVTPSSGDTDVATLNPASLTFTSSNWDTAQTITVSGEEDVNSDDETVTVSHSVSGYGAVTTADSVSVTVTDNDTAGVSVSPTSLSVDESGTTTYTVVLNTDPSGSVTVTPSSDDTGAATLSPASLTFTSSNWDTAQTITVSGEEDDDVNNETVAISHSVSGYGSVTTAANVSVTVTDNDTAGVSVSPTSLSVEESGTTTYTVVLTTEPSSTVTITPSSNDTGAATFSPSGLTFTSSNWGTAQTVTVSGAEDDDANDETVAISHSVSGYGSVTTAAEVSVTVNDNDTAGVSVSPTSLSVDESGTTTYTVVLTTEPSSTVTVTPSSDDTGAATLSPSSLTFTSGNWDTAQTVTVSGEEDDDVNNETVAISHSVSGYGSVTTAANVSVTVNDNDTAGVSVSPTSLSVNESGTTTYTVVLNTEPSGTVTVTPSSGDTGAATLSPSSLTFTSGNWKTAQTVTVSGAEDDDANDETVAISHSVSGYGSVTTAANVSVTVNDNDTAGVSVSPTSLSVNESGTTTYTVVLNTEPSGTVTVTPSSDDTGAATLSPSSLTFTSGNWKTAQTVTVSGAEDDDANDETVAISHSISGYGSVTTAAEVSVTVNDNDTAGVSVSPTSLSVNESGTTTYTVVLNTEPSGTVTVTPSSGDTGAATLSPSSLTFTSGNWKTAQTVTVSGAEDDDANDETVAISHSVSGYGSVTTAANVSVTVNDNDTAGVSVSPTSLSVNESGTTTYTVVLNTEPSGTVTVTPSSGDTGAATLSPSSLTFTSGNWKTAQTVTVSGAEDDDANDKTVAISHSVSGYGSVTTAAEVSVTVNDNDTAGVSVSPTSLSVNESGTTTYTVVLNTEPSGTVTVTPSSGDTGAATLSPSSLTFTSGNWKTAQTVTVSGAEDDDANDETVAISHSVSGYGSVTTAAEVSVTVNDNDTAGVSVSPTSLSLAEGETTTYTVVLITEPSGTVTVTPSSNDTGAATFSPSGLTFTSSNWGTAQTVTVSGEEDDDANNETVTVSHSVSGYDSVSTADDVSVTVSDNDTAGVSISPTSLSVDESGTTTYTVVLNTEPNGSVTVTPSSDDTGAATLSPASLTFTSSNWDTAQTVTVSGEEDNDANDETVTVSHSVSGYDSVTTADDVSVTVSDNDTAGVSISPTSLSVDESGTTTYTVVLTAEPNGSVTVTPSSDDTGAATLSPASLTFTSSNWDTAQTITVSGEEDDDANDETVTVSHSVSGYSGVTTAADVSVTVSDNDTPGVSVSPTSLSVDESGTTTYTVVLNTEPNGSVTVTPSSDDTGAATLSPASLTFTSSNWDTAQTITVSGEEDDDANDETVTVSHSVSGYSGVTTAADVSVTVSDNDTAGVSVSPTSLSVDESGTTTYTVVLDTEPNGSVTVTPSSDDTGAATLSPASLTFTSSNWDTAQTITVSGEEDDDANDETVTVSHSVSGYGAVTTVADVSVTVSDNDTPGVSVSPTSLSVDEGETTTYAVVLNTEPSGTVTVTPSSSDTDAAMLSPASLTFSSSNWATAQTVTVSGEEDDDADDEIVTVSHSVSGYVGVTTVADVSITVTDNDTIDAANPQVTSIERLTPPSSPTNADSLTWRVTFNKDVKNVDAADFTVSSTTATVTVSEVTAATVYDVTASDGDLALLNATVTLGFSDGQDIQDTDDSALITAPTGANETTYVLDNIQPSVTITGVPATSAASFSATFSFSEPVTGFAVEDVIVGNGAASAFSVTTADEVWTALITPTASGTVTVDVGAGVAVDAAGNDNTAATLASSTYTSPSVAPPSDRDPDATREGAVPLPAIETTQGEPSLYGQGGALDPGNGDMIDYYSFTVPTTTTTSQVSGQLQRLAAARGEASPLTIAQQVAIQVTGRSDLMAVTLEDNQGRPMATASTTTDNPSLHQINTLLEPGVYYIKVEATEAVPVDYDLRLALTTPPPLSVSVADARAEEGAAALLHFRVRLDRPATATVTVDYASEDDTATAGTAGALGADYVAASGILTFQAGEKEQTVSVVVLEDSLEEGEEQLRLRLSNPSAGLTIRDGEATGVITETNAVPIDWLARFGRTVTDQVLEAVEQRLKPGRQEGVQVQIAGQAVPVDGNQPAILRLDGNEEQPAQPPLLERWLLSRKLPSAQEWVTGSSFALTTTEEDSEEEKGNGGGHLSLWGLGAIAGFDSRQHDFSLDGQVTTALMGTDWATGQWTAGLALGRSTGTGHYRQSDCATDRCSGDIEATLTGLYPYVGGVQHNDRRTLWAAAGYGMGDLTLRSPNGKRLSTDLTMTMGAAGLRSQLQQPEDNGDGFSLAVKGDARFTRTSSKELPSTEGNLSAAKADIWRLRVGIEAARPMTVGAANATVTPSFEMGLRLDGGDADTGFGTDIGAGVVLANPRNGIHLDLAARGLVAHETADFQEWGAAASLSWDPQPDIEQGFSAQLTQSWGASPSGGMEALLQRQSMAEVAATDGNGEAVRFVADSRLEAELGYGLPLWDGAFTLTPNIGFAFSETVRDYRIGWRLSPAPPPAAAYHPLELELDVTRSERTDSDAPATHGVMLRSTLLW